MNESAQNKLFPSETRTYISITDRLLQWTSILHSHWSKPLSLIRPIRRKQKDFLAADADAAERILKNCRKYDTSELTAAAPIEYL